MISRIALFPALLVAISEITSGQPGTLDNSFANNGIFTFVVPGEQINHATGIVLQSDGKYVIGGKVNGPAEPRMVAVRINPEGTIDSSFGIDGYSANNVMYRSFAHTIGIQEDQKILLLGQDYQPIGNLEDFGMIRLNTDGSLDGSFGSGGKAAIDYGLGEEGYKVIQRPGGKLLLAGFSTWDVASQTSEILKNNFCVGRIMENGAKDSTFGTYGVFTLDMGDRNDYGTGMMVTPDDKIISVGFSSGFDNTYAVMFRLGDSGVIDSTFGENGIVSSLVGMGSSWNSIIRQTDGKIVVGGRNLIAPDNYDLLVERYKADGTRDSTFGNNGLLVLDAGGVDEIVEDVKLMADGKIILAGYSGEGQQAKAIVIRLHPDGTLDTMFADLGIFSLSISNGFDKVKECLIDADGKIVVAGFSQTSNGDTIFVFRLLNDLGTATGPDQDFTSQNLYMEVYPNPADNFIHCTYDLPVDTYVGFELSNMLDQRIMVNEPSFNSKGVHHHMLNLQPDLAGGFYYLVLKTPEAISVQPVILK